MAKRFKRGSSKENVKKVLEDAKNEPVPKRSGFTMKKAMPFIIGLALVSALVLGINFLNSRPGQYDSFAQCLTDKGAKFYGSFQCTHCQTQKKMFGNSIKYVPYIECGPLTGFTNKECIEGNITSVPLWRFADGVELSGTRQLPELATASGCPLQ